MQNNSNHSTIEKNSTIITWKWEDTTLACDMEKEIDELCSRFSPFMLCISLHWVPTAFEDEGLQEKIRECKHFLDKKGVKLCVEACPRNEGEGFYRAYPMEGFPYLAHFETLTLDELGNGEKIIDAETVYHYWRKSGLQGVEKVYAAYCFSEGEGYLTYRQDSLKNITDVFIENLELDGVNKNRISVKAGRENGRKTAVVCLLTRQPLPDLASPKFPEYFRKMMSCLEETMPGGVFSDEWGYDVILKITEQNPYDDNQLFLKHISLSDAFAQRYHALHNGNLKEDCLHFLYAPENRPEVRIAAVNRYLSTLRKVMAQNDEDMYAITKEVLGQDAFYGVHPTWWGSVSLQNFEFYKNGFYWWEAKRDIAQTDEVVIMPIRTALCHKWGSHIFYNMWYSMGTRKVETYYRDTWNSVRYGGRTHHHAYRCPNEPVVLELAGEGILESLEEMEKKVRVIDHLQKSAADCRVLVLFGMEAVSNWALPYTIENGEIKGLLPPWTPKNEKLEKVLNTTNELFGQILCDLVPTSEIENGSVTLNSNGLPCYGTQEYDAVILLYPEILPEKCHDLIGRIEKSRLIVCGETKMYSDGRDAAQETVAYIKSAAYAYSDIPSAQVLAENLFAMGISPNRIKSGCKLQDGAWIFTAEGEKATGNSLVINETINGHKIQFDGDDFLYIEFDGGDCHVVHGGGRILT